MSSGKIYDIWHRRHDYWLLAGIVTYPWPSQAGQDPGVFLCGPRGGDVGLWDEEPGASAPDQVPRPVPVEDDGDDGDHNRGSSLYPQYSL